MSFSLRFRSRDVIVGGALAACVTVAYAHDVTTHVTWNREISRIVFTRCAPCHRLGGTAFSLMTYAEASPWAKGIKESVLTRSMPPWGAVKGFGHFRNDQSLTQEELDLFEKWVNGGAPEGNPNDLPSRPRIVLIPVVEPRPGERTMHDGDRFETAFVLDGFRSVNHPKGQTAQVTIGFPDGRVEPLVWLSGDDGQVDHPFLLRRPLAIPAGAVLHGLPAGSSLVLMPLAR
jgi:hypothetical protein